MRPDGAQRTVLTRGQDVTSTSSSNLLSKIPGWVGFLGLIVVGTAMVLTGLVNNGLDRPNTVGFIVFGLAAILIGGLSWLAGGTSAPKDVTGKVGIRISIADVPFWAWLADIAAFVLAVILFFALR